MMHLPPAAIYQLIDASRANVEIFYDITLAIGTAFTSNGPKYIARAVYGVVPKYNMNVRRTLEDSLIHHVWLICSPPNASERIIDRDLIGTSKVFVDHLEITGIEAAVELSQCLLGLAQVSQIFVTCDGILHWFLPSGYGGTERRRKQCQVGCQAENGRGE